METPRETSLPQDSVGGPSVESVKIRELFQNHKSLTRVQGHYTFEDLKTEGDIDVDWEFRPETAGFSVSGHLQGQMLLECARCLSEYPLPVDLDIDERYVFDHYVDPTEREKELQAEDFFEVINEEGLLDLKDLAHQFLVLESAEHSLCERATCEFSQDSQANG